MQPSLENLPLTQEALQLASKYLEAKVIPRRCEADANHVAIAVCNSCDFLVTLNMKHLANLERIRAFNAVNADHGYNPNCDWKSRRSLFR
jgi:hypothetical protein